MNKNQIITKTINFVREKLIRESSGHDWWHIERVWKMAKFIACQEKADLFIVELAALLHDIADWKFNDDNVALKISSDWLLNQNVDQDIIEKIIAIIKDVSFKGSKFNKKMQSKEGQIVQDADRLDALGAIGIARCFAYGGFKGREIYNPDLSPQEYTSIKEFKQSNSSSINHFYEKLFLLKDLMNTQTGIKIALKRHKFMQTFIGEFMKEWNGDKN
ncbi:HD domain-containing protein [Candidatus Beckwithbacteria bacterium]|nr:HD domain-containing protein [Candidatus Beckwithbacteria bacterium]